MINRRNCSTCKNSVLSKTNKIAQHKCDNCLTVECSPSSLAPTQYEPYDFSVGDYVETLGGDIGYIDYVNPDSSIIHINFNGVLSCTEFKFKDHIGEFKRIGKYDFTKTQSEEKNIEHLEYGHTEKKNCSKVEIKSQNYPNSSTLHWVDELNDVYVKTDTSEIIRKLNEVIDRVNEIGENK